MEGQKNNAFETLNKQVHSAIEDLKTKGRRHRQIPNLLTLMRLTAPCFIIPTAVIGNLPLTIGLTIFFSLTDLADGFIARNWYLTSELGEVLDAFTDKVFASTLLFAASFTNPILLLNLGLECGIAGINTYKKLNDKPVKSTLIGKIKTWFLFALVGVGYICPFFDLTNIVNSLSLVTSAMQLFTTISYLFPTSNNKIINNQINKNGSEVVVDVNDIEFKEIKKEKILENNDFFSENVCVENNSLKQLKEIRKFLVSEQFFLNTEINNNNNNNRIKSKKDDFRKK